MATIYAQFPSKCCVCGEAIAKGAQFNYAKGGDKGKKATCLICHSKTATPQAPAPQSPAATFLDKSLTTGNRLHIQRYDSISAMMAGVSVIAKINQPLSEEISQRRTNQTQTNLIQWFGVPLDWSDVLKLIATGWTEGLQRVEDALTTIDVPAIKGIRRRKVRGDFGDELDIHSINRGEFDTAWSRRTRKNAPHGHAQKTILLQLGGLVDVSSERLFWRGAAAVKICDALVEAGYSVEIIGSFATNEVSTKGGDDILTTFIVKSHDMPLDRVELSTVATLAGFFRTYGFMAKLCHNMKIKTGLGLTDYTLMHEEHRNNPDVITGLYQINNQEQAQAFINNCIRNLGREDTEQQAA